MIGSKSLEINPFEKMQLQVGGYCQLAIKVPPFKVSDYINEISKKAIGCRVYYDGEKFRYTPSKCRVFRIPDNFPTLNETIIYSSLNFTVPITERLASICYNNDTIVLNSSHSASDGGYLKNILLYLEGKSTIKGPDPFIYESVYDTFSETVKNIEGNLPRSSTKLKSKNLEMSDFTSISHLIPFEIPIEKVSTFSNGKIHKITELLWSSLILTASAFNKKFTDCKILNAFDLRQIMKNIGWQHVNHNTNFMVEARGISENSKICDMKNKFRLDFENKCKSGVVLKAVKDFINGSIEMIDYTSLHLSNIGTLSTGGDVKDAYIGLSTHTIVPPPGFVVLFADCIDNKLLRGRLLVTPSVMDKYDSIKFADAIKYCITSVHDDTKFHDAMHKIISEFRFF